MVLKPLVQSSSECCCLLCQVFPHTHPAFDGIIQQRYKASTTTAATSSVGTVELLLRRRPPRLFFESQTWEKKWVRFVVTNRVFFFSGRRTDMLYDVMRIARVHWHAYRPLVSTIQNICGAACADTVADVKMNFPRSFWRKRLADGATNADG